ncbi:MAG: AAA family ATPase, partial [Deltaproteobacteria bacterium]|nr:AAA family ATPase [Deltaproteobacteria bacterium]
MRLTGFYIEGFGIFRDLNVRGLSPGLTIFFGENESGKSTLLGFLRAVLFGFPDGRSHENPYPPLSGGRHGGNISLVTASQDEYVVERLSGPRGGKVDVIKPDQSHAGKAFLGQFLGMANRTLFKNIFAIGLSELQTLDTLSTDAVQEALYSAGAGIDHNRLAKFKSDLERGLNGLFKPGGSKPKINTILSRLMAITKEKNAITGSIDQYDQITGHLAELNDRIGRLEEKRRRLSNDLKKVRQWIHLWPDGMGYFLTGKKLGDMEMIEHFPSQGLLRFESLMARIEETEESLAAKAADLQRQQSELSGLVVDDRILELSPAIKELQSGQGHFEAVQRDLLTITRDIQNQDQKVGEGLARLGACWDEEKVRGVDLSIATGETVRGFRNDLQQAEMEEQKKRELFQEAVVQKNEIQSRVRGLSEIKVKSREELTRLEDQVKGLKSAHATRRDIKNRIGQIGDRLDDLDQEKRVLGEIMKPGPRLFPLWLIVPMAGIGIFLVLWFGIRHQWVVSLTVGVLFVIAVGSFLASWSRWSARARDKENDIHQQLRQLDARMSELQGERDVLTGRENDLQREVASLPAVFSSGGAVSDADIDRIEGDVTAQAKGFERWSEALQDLEKAEMRLDRLRDDIIRAEEKTQDILNCRQHWLREMGLDAALSPEGALDTMSLIASCKDQINHLNRLKTKKDALEASR